MINYKNRQVPRSKQAEFNYHTYRSRSEHDNEAISIPRDTHSSLAKDHYVSELKNTKHNRKFKIPDLSNSFKLNSSPLNYPFPNVIQSNRKAYQNMKRNAYCFISESPSLEIKEIEEWLIDILISGNQNFDQQKRKSILRSFGIDQNTLKHHGISSENIGRLYRGLFIYTIGLHSMLREILEKTDDKKAILAKFWIVYSMILETVQKSDYQSAIQFLEKNKNEIKNQLTSENKIKDEIIQKMQINEVEVFQKLRKEIDRLQQNYNEVITEKNQVEMNLLIREDAFNEEVSTRLQFEVKINQIYNVYRELLSKQEQLIEDLKAEKASSEELKKQIAERDDRIVILLQQEGAFKANIEDLLSQLSARDQKYHELNQNFENFKSYYNQLRKQSEEDHKELRYQLHQNQLVNIQASAIKLEYEVSSKEKTKFRELSSLYEQQIIKLSQKIGNYDQTLLVQQNQINQLTTNLQEANDNIQQFKVNLENKSSSYDQLKKDVYNQNKIYYVQKENVEFQFEKLSYEFQLIKMKCDNLERSLQSQVESTKILVTEKNDKIDQIRKIQEEKQKFEENLISINKINQQLNDSMEIKNQELKDNLFVNEQLKTKINSLEELNINLNRELNFKSKYINDLQKQFDERIVFITIEYQRNLNQVQLLQRQSDSQSSELELKEQQIKTQQQQLTQLKNQFEKSLERNEQYAQQIAAYGGNVNEIIKKNIIFMKLLKGIQRELGGEFAIKKVSQTIQQDLINSEIRDISVIQLISDALTAKDEALNLNFYKSKNQEQLQLEFNNKNTDHLFRVIQEYKINIHKKEQELIEIKKLILFFQIWIKRISTLQLSKEQRWQSSQIQMKEKILQNEEVLKQIGNEKKSINKILEEIKQNQISLSNIPKIIEIQDLRTNQKFFEYLFNPNINTRSFDDTKRQRKSRLSQIINPDNFFAYIQKINEEIQANQKAKTNNQYEQLKQINQIRQRYSIANDQNHHSYSMNKQDSQSSQILIVSEKSETSSSSEDQSTPTMNKNQEKQISGSNQIEKSHQEILQTSSQVIQSIPESEFSNCISEIEIIKISQNSSNNQQNNKIIRKEFGSNKIYEDGQEGYQMASILKDNKQVALDIQSSSDIQVPLRNQQIQVPIQEQQIEDKDANQIQQELVKQQTDSSKINNSQVDQIENLPKIINSYTSIINDSEYDNEQLNQQALNQQNMNKRKQIPAKEFSHLYQNASLYYENK